MLKINEQGILKDLRTIKSQLNTVSLENCIDTLQLLTKSMSFLKDSKSASDTEKEWNDYCKLKFKLGRQFVDIIRLYNEKLTMLINESYYDLEDEFNYYNDVIDNVININNQYICSKEFKAKEDFQIDLKLNDVVTINQFTNNYVLGKNCNTNSEGLFPIYYIERLDGKPLFFRCKEELEYASINEEIFLMQELESDYYPGYNITRDEPGFFPINKLEPIYMNDEVRKRYEALYNEETDNDGDNGNNENNGYNEYNEYNGNNGNNKECDINDSYTSDIDIKELVQHNSDFDFIFLKMENNKTNMLYSPLSLKYTLKMLEEGAAGNTLAEIKKVLKKTILNKYESANKFLSFANGLFIRDKYYKDVKTEYLNLLKEKYDAEIKPDEFNDAQNVNQWIEDKTLGIIKNMVSDKMVQDPTSVMILINALAIDLEWMNQFRREKTRGEPFYKDDKHVITATTMSIEAVDDNLSYYRDNDITAISMNLKNYNGIQLEFMAIMPEENLKDYVKNITKEQINVINKNLTLASHEIKGVILHMPKFKYSYSLKLKKDLINLGIKSVFDPSHANLSKIANPEDSNHKLYVSNALHRADIEFTEKGAKVAAVTIMYTEIGSGVSGFHFSPCIIRLNKPFMFIIRDKITKDIWFTGTLYEPNLWENDKKDYYN